MYESLIDALRLCVKYEKADNALANANIAADAINELLSEVEKYRHAAFIISETCVEASKQHITPEAALQKIRENIYLERVHADENKVLHT